MRAYELHPKENFEALTVVDRPTPAVGPHDVRVRVRAVSLNYRDLTIARGTKARPRPKPIVAASDGAGEVVAVGDRVTRFRVGERVAALFFPNSPKRSS